MNQFLRLLLLLLLCSSWLSAQDLEFNLRYDLDENRYEVYVRPISSGANFVWGPSQISIVAPASVADDPFMITSVAAGTWQDNSQIYAPTAAPGNDFHGVGSFGSPVMLSAGVETLLFYFSVPGEECIPGIRLYENGLDPDSAAPGMGGNDFTNTIIGGDQGGTPGEQYLGNYDNLGVACDCEEPIVIGCIADINFTLGDQCQLRLTPAMVLTGDYLCAFDYEFLVDGEDTDFVSGCGDHTYMITLFNAAGEEIYTCWGDIFAEDKTDPVVDCPDNTSTVLAEFDLQTLEGSIDGTEDEITLGDYSCFQSFFEPAPE